MTISLKKDRLIEERQFHFDRLIEERQFHFDCIAWVSLYISCTRSRCHSISIATDRSLITIITTMAPSISSVLFLCVVVLMATDRISGDPDALQDFCVADSSSSVFMNGLPCLNPNEASAQHFMTSALRTPGNTSDNPMGVSIVAANTQNMPGINTLGILMARVDMAVGGIVPPHIHPRASETLYLMEGKLSVGFVDSNTNRLFSHTLETGDVFVFPKGTLHFAQNIGEKPAITINALNSQNPGILNVPSAIFVSSPGIPQEVLANSFAISSQEVEQIRKLLGGTSNSPIL